MDEKMQKRFLEAYDNYSDGIFRYCLYRTFDRELAADLTQESFLRAWTVLTEGKAVENLRAFIYRIARNLIIDNSRRKKETSLDVLLETIDFAGKEDLGAKADAKLLLAKLPELSDEYREVIVMRYIDDLGPAEIAEILGETPNTISIRLNRALNQLREIFK